MHATLNYKEVFAEKQHFVDYYLVVKQSAPMPKSPGGSVVRASD